MKSRWMLLMMAVMALTAFWQSPAAADMFSERQESAFFPPASRMSRTYQAATAEEIALAMDVPADSIVSVSLGDSDPKGAGIYDEKLGKHLPTKGNTFAVLSTGYAESAATADNSGGLSNVLEGLNNVFDTGYYTSENDMVQFTLELSPPSSAKCFGFDFVYYSEEYPEYVGTMFNDTFLAELGESTFVIYQDTATYNFAVDAPNNFAFDTQDNIISVNSVFGMAAETNTTYDGGTSLLKATSPIPDGTDTVTIIFTIQDLGDSIYDSAVFLDNFYWSSDENCAAGALEDSDGDGLLDDWEINGLDADGDGTVDVNLPAMGADPFHKDIFLEIDYMAETICEGGLGFGACYLHSHQSKLAAVKKVMDAFANAPVENPNGATGIRLHIDAGRDFVMNPATGEKWGDLSGANALFHDDYLGTGDAGAYDWSEFEALKSKHFSSARKNIFRYCVFGNELSEALAGISGASRGVPGSGFVVTLNSWADGVGTAHQQAGALMHGLGNNLGLKSGGGDNIPYKPNFLSVMNPAFQMRGLRKDGNDGHFDYSRFTMPALDEANLDETAAFGSGHAEADVYGTRFFDPDGQMKIIDSVTEPVDWNGDGVLDVDVEADINGDGQIGIIGNVIDEWDSLIFKGGEVGALGIIYEPPAQTDPTNLDKETDAAIPSPYAVLLSGPKSVILEAGANGNYTLVIQNIGENADAYDLSAETILGWADVSALPASISLEPDAEQVIEIPVSIPTDAIPGQIDQLTIGFTSQANANLTEELIAELKLLEPGDANSDTTVDVADILTLVNVILQKGVALGHPNANGDHSIDVLDILAALNKILQK